MEDALKYLHLITPNLFIASITFSLGFLYALHEFTEYRKRKHVKKIFGGEALPDHATVPGTQKVKQ